MVVASTAVVAVAVAVAVVVVGAVDACLKTDWE